LRFGRTSLITTGIALAIAFSTIMLSIGEAIQHSSMEIIEDTGVDLLVEPPIELPPLILEFISIFEISNGREIADAMVRDNRKIREASPWLMENLYMSKKPDELNVQQPPKFSLFDCRGYIPERNRHFGAYKIIEGSPLPTENDPFYADGTFQNGFESDNFTHEILISKLLSEILNVTIGDIVYVNPVLISDDFTNQSLEEWYDNATWFKIYGIKEGLFESQNALTGHIHLSELQFITGKYKNDLVNKIYLSLHDKSDSKKVKSWLETDFVYKDQISVHEPEELLEDLSDFTQMFEGFSRMVVIITILVAILFISTVLMISTRERSMEIGALRAIGISKGTISKFIFKESLIICLIALAIGLIIGYFASDYINSYIISTQPIVPEGFKVTMITPTLIAQVSILTVIISLLAALGPSYWAMRLKPVETLRNE
jgi:ABC-type lipoprotein release transport system permease subunit